MLTTFRGMITIGLMLSIGACASVRSISAGERLTDNSKMIRVILNDDRQIEFPPEKYTVHGEQDSVYIDGTGHQSLPGGGQTAFTGTIRRPDVREIQVINSTTFQRVYAPIIIVVAMGAVFVGLGYLFFELL